MYSFLIELGLKYIHEQGICHRDLKPSNIFLTHSGTIKVRDSPLRDSSSNQIGDFGLAKELKWEDDGDDSDCECPSFDSSAMDLTAGIGTPTYAPPEQLKRRNYDYKVDIYSLGKLSHLP